jgi:hypothetical protein
MAEDHSDYANVGIGVGLVMQHAFPIIVGAFTPRPLAMMSFIVVLLGYLAGFVCLVWGGSHMMASKGRSRAWSVLGIFGLLGVIILACIPERKASVTSQHNEPIFQKTS